jgi:hypothetical protein
MRSSCSRWTAWTRQRRCWCRPINLVRPDRISRLPWGFAWPSKGSFTGPCLCWHLQKTPKTAPPTCCSGWRRQSRGRRQSKGHWQGKGHRQSRRQGSWQRCIGTPTGLRRSGGQRSPVWQRNPGAAFQGGPVIKDAKHRGGQLRELGIWPPIGL